MLFNLRSSDSNSGGDCIQLSGELVFLTRFTFLTQLA